MLSSVRSVVIRVGMVQGISCVCAMSYGFSMALVILLRSVNRVQLAVKTMVATRGLRSGAMQRAGLCTLLSSAVTCSRELSIWTVK